MSPESEPSSKNSPPAFRPPMWVVCTFVLLCLAVAGFTKITTRPNVVPEAGVKMQLPERVLGMHGEEQEVSEAERIILPDDTEFAKMNYTDGLGNWVNCQIVLSGGDRRSIHRPEACLPAQGWNMLSSEPTTVDLPGGSELTVQKLRLSRDIDLTNGQKGTLPMLFVYWYVGDNLTTHDQLQRVLRSNLDLLIENKVHRWAYVIVSAPVLAGLSPNGLNEEQTMERLREFIREAVPQFQKSEFPTMESGEIPPGIL